MMNRLWCLIYFATIILNFTHENLAQGSTIRPVRHSLHSGLQSLNGSSSNGGCTSVNGGNICELDVGHTSVLVDNTILPLSGLDGNQWARDLYTVERGSTSFISIGFDFGTSVRVRRVELVLFNCLQWSIGVGNIEIYVRRAYERFPLSNPNEDVRCIGNRQFLNGTNLCENLYRVCLSLLPEIEVPVFYIVFPNVDGSDRVYLAETIFYNDSTSCGPDTLVTSLVTTTTEELPLTATNKVTTLVKEITTQVPTTIAQSTMKVQDTTSMQSKNITKAFTTAKTAVTRMLGTTVLNSTESISTNQHSTTTKSKNIKEALTTTVTAKTMSNNKTIIAAAVTAALLILCLIAGVSITVIMIRFKTKVKKKSESSNIKKYTHSNLGNSDEKSQKIELHTSDLHALYEALTPSTITPAFGYDSLDTTTNKGATLTTSTTQQDNPQKSLDEMYTTVQKTRKNKDEPPSPPIPPPYRANDVYAVVQKKTKKKKVDNKEPPPVPPQTTDMLYAAVN